MPDDLDEIRLSDTPEPLHKAVYRIAQHFASDGEPVVFRYQVEMLAQQQADEERWSEADEER